MGSAVGLRERKKAETRLAIARSALMLAVKRGPDAITVDDIAAAANVSARTVFNYFATKEQAILGFDVARAVELAEQVTARPARVSPLAALRDSFVGIAADNPEVAETARQRSALVREHPQLQAHYIAGFAMLENVLVAAVATRTDLDPTRSSYPRLVVSTAITCFRVALDRAGPGAVQQMAAIQEAFDLLASGLRVPK